MDKQLLGKRIRLARKEKGYTGEALSELCSISPTYLRQIESGAKIPSLPVFVQLCTALKVSPAYLFADVCCNMEASAAFFMDRMVDRDDLGEYEYVKGLWRQASPNELRLALAIVRSVLEELQEVSLSRAIFSRTGTLTAHREYAINELSLCTAVSTFFLKMQV